MLQPSRRAQIIASIPGVDAANLCVAVPADSHSKAVGKRATAPRGAVDQLGRLLQTMNTLIEEASAAEQPRLRALAELCLVHGGLRAHVLGTSISDATRRAAHVLGGVPAMNSPSAYSILQRFRAARQGNLHLSSRGRHDRPLLSDSEILVALINDFIRRTYFKRQLRVLLVGGWHAMRALDTSEMPESDRVFQPVAVHVQAFLSTMPDAVLEVERWVSRARV